MTTYRSPRPKTALRVNLYADTDPAAYALFAPLGTKAQAALLRRMLSAALGEASNSVVPLAIERTAPVAPQSPPAEGSANTKRGAEQDQLSSASDAASLPELAATRLPSPVPSQPPSPPGSGLWAAFSAGLDDGA